MEKRLGIYIHIPFCAGKCAYCDFYSLVGRENMIPRYQKALLMHIRESGSQLEGYLIDSVYFGGGTPSFYGAENLIEIFNALKKHGRVLIDSEVTVEVNPDSITYQDLLKLRRAGFNRLSIGAQSANDGILKSVGRLHNFAQVEETVKDARRAGFENVSLDLIYGLPSQTREDWADTLTRAAALKPDHFSCYGLKIEEGTALYPFKDSPFIPDGDLQADMYLYMVDALDRYGYKQYEISNFARRGRSSRHNLKYWQMGEYMGFGAAAHSCVSGQRYSCIADMELYTENILTGKSVVDQAETITDFERAGEYLMLGLRTTRGISEKEYYDIYPCRFDMAAELMDSYIGHGWMVKNDDRWSFTPEGFLLSNVLIGEVLDAQTKQRMNIVSPWKKDEDEEYQFSMFNRRPGEIQLFHGIS
ncbi:MAG: radical SAM family heme chaperone HemW [Oscillospiraceae bacterium]